MAFETAADNVDQGGIYLEHHHEARYWHSHLIDSWGGGRKSGCSATSRVSLLVAFSITFE